MKWNDQPNFLLSKHKKKILKHSAWNSILWKLDQKKNTLLGMSNNSIKDKIVVARTFKRINEETFEPLGWASVVCNQMVKKSENSVMTLFQKNGC